MGADLSYRCLGGNLYEFTLVFYRSCETNTAPPLSGDLQISSASCGFNGNNVLNLALPLVNFTEIAPICPTDMALSQCADPANPYPSVEQYTYQGQFLLPANCRDWEIAWFTCCRNANITNAVISPVFTEMRLVATLNNLDVSCNSSPTFTNVPTPFINANQPYWYNNGATDPDGDSLVFEMVNPLENDLFFPPGSAPVPFQPGFSATNPVATAPPNSFSFDSVSGQMYFVPDGPQWDIMTVQVKEYRNGMLIGSTMRDLQIVVHDNPLNQQPVFLPPANVTGGSNKDFSFSVCAGNTLSFDIQIEDPNLSDVLSLTETISAALPGATVGLSGQNPVVVSVSWPTTMADLGRHFFLLTAEDNSCPLFSRQSAGYVVNVHRGVVATPPRITICPGSNNSVQLLAQVEGGTGNGSFSWSPATGLSNPNIPNPVANVTDTITYTVVYDDGGCQSTAQVQLVAEGEIQVLTPDPEVCLGDSVQIETTFVPALAGGPPACGTTNSPCQGSSTEVLVGTGSGSTEPAVNPAQVAGAGSPFPGFREDARTQVLFRANELTAAGLQAGLITALSLEVSAKFSATPYNNFTIKMGCTNLNTLVAFQTGLEVVYTNTVNTTPGTNLFTFDVPYQWDGTSNLLVEFCYNNPDGLVSGNDHVFFTPTAYNSVVFNANDESAGGEPGCDISSGAAFSQRPNMRFSNCSLDLPLAYSWSPVQGLSDPFVSNPMASPALTTTYTLTVTTPSCSFTDTVRVRVNQAPQLGNLADVAICEGDSAQLMVNGNFISDATFSWSPPAALSDATAQNPTAFPGMTTNYLVTATNACGSDVQGVRVVVNQPPPLLIDVNDLSCNGADDGSIAVSPSGGQGPFSYNWQPGNLNGPSISGLRPGSYQLLFTDGNSCTIDTSLVVTEPPVLSLSIDTIANV
ncbi:MAG: hypothetical protein D6730_15305, partial [Bacteroidetes bacterium]